MPFYAAACLTFVNVIYGFFVLPESLKAVHRRPFELARAHPLGAFKQLWQYPVIIALLVVYFCYLLGHFALPSIWAFFTIEKFAWSRRDIGFSLRAVGAAMIFVQAYLIPQVLPLWGAVSAKYYVGAHPCQRARRVTRCHRQYESPGGHSQSAVYDTVVFVLQFG